jgi:subtilisin family serine protease
LNAVFHNATPFKDKSILVGALDQEGGSIASYSNQAGDYADRFVVADGRGLMQADGSYAQGTSFAAPRVAGYAAIIRQKFPNLTAANTASVILDTASWNASWGDKSAANMAVYGQGEASLGRALAPVGRLR